MRIRLPEPEHAPAPVFVYDGKCSFCSMWIEFWRSLTGNRVDFQPSPTPIEAVKFGEYSGAEAVCELTALAPGYGWMLFLYRRLPGFAWLANRLYRFVARHRTAAYRITRLLWGREVVRPTYTGAAANFSRALCFIYLIAFASFGTQVRGLAGATGILPASDTLWWPHTDFALLAIAWGGVALSVIALLTIPHSKWQRLIFILLFVYYSAIVSAATLFMSYQWDLLLLETGFLAIFLRPALTRVWLFQWLLFRLMFESGAVKLLSGDSSWRNLTALSVHYFTQPLPNIVAWYMWQLPAWFHETSTFLVLAGECLLPLLMFAPRRLRHVAAWGTIALQSLIFCTGNYTFFNLLTIALCLFLFEDSGPAAVTTGSSNRWVSAALFLFVMIVSTAELMDMFGRAPRPMNTLVAAQGEYGLVNPYGLFAVMTTTRHEIEIEGSNDGENWQPYIFRYKPGPLNRAPGWIAPFQPRLDWQMWFAALGSYRENPWFARLMLQLLQGSKPVLALFEYDPFHGTPPIHVRASLYDYRFTTAAERRQTGNWWHREPRGLYFPPVSLRLKAPVQ